MTFKKGRRKMENEVFEGPGFSIKVHSRTYNGVPYTGIPKNLEVQPVEETTQEIYRINLSDFRTNWTVNGKRSTAFPYRGTLSAVGLLPTPEGVKLPTPKYFPFFDGDGVHAVLTPSKMTNNRIILDAFYGREMAAMILSKLPTDIWEKLDDVTRIGQQV